MAENQTYSHHIIEIADYLFAHPHEKVQSVVALFCTRMHKSVRSVKTYIQKAKEYNTERLAMQEKAKDEVLAKDAVESLKNGILTRNELLAISSRIARGEPRLLDGAEDMIPSDGDSIRAIAFLWEKLGFDEIKDTKNHHEVIIKYVNHEQKNNEKPV
jgi:hypothetical protein